MPSSAHGEAQPAGRPAAERPWSAAADGTPAARLPAVPVDPGQQFREGGPSNTPSPETNSDDNWLNQNPYINHTLPPWITAELVQYTMETWQPHYGRPLTIDEATEILHNFGRLIDHLGEYEP
jgi:hypothetical protein